MTIQVGDRATLAVDQPPYWNKGDVVVIHSIHECKRCGHTEYEVVHAEHMDMRDFTAEELEANKGVEGS